jgi:hypothetical protein
MEALERRELLSISTRSALMRDALAERMSQEAPAFEASPPGLGLRPTRRAQESAEESDLADRRLGQPSLPRLTTIHATLRARDVVFSDIARKAVRSPHRFAQPPHPELGSSGPVEFVPVGNGQTPAPPLGIVLRLSVPNSPVLPAPALRLGEEVAESNVTNDAADDFVPLSERPPESAWSSDGVGVLDRVRDAIANALVRPATIDTPSAENNRARTLPARAGENEVVGPNRAIRRNTAAIDPAAPPPSADAFDRVDANVGSTESRSSTAEPSNGLIDIGPYHQGPTSWPLDQDNSVFQPKAGHAERGSSHGRYPDEFDSDRLDGQSPDATESGRERARDGEDADQATSSESERLASRLAPDPTIGGMIELPAYTQDQDAIPGDMVPRYDADESIAAIEMDEDCGVLRAFELAMAQVSRHPDDVSGEPPLADFFAAGQLDLLASDTPIDRGVRTAERDEPSEDRPISWPAIAAISAGGLVLAHRRRHLHDFVLSKMGRQDLAQKDLAPKM